MGVDARMYLRVRRAERPSDDEMRDASFAIRERIGDDVFFPLFPSWAYDGYEPGPLILASEDDENGRWTTGKGFYQDGPDVLAADDDDWFVYVRLACRYYGRGYERGPIPRIIDVAEWCERNVRNDDGTPCEVLYGGDSSGICAEPFGPHQRRALADHFYGPDGDGYRDRTGRWSEFRQPPTACQRCPSTGPRWFANNSRTGTCRGCMREFRLIEGEWTLAQQEK